MSEQNLSDADWLRELFNPPTNYDYRFDAKAVGRAFRIAQQLESAEQQLAAASERERKLQMDSDCLQAAADKLECDKSDVVREIVIAQEREAQWIADYAILRAREAELRKCVELYADPQMWVDMTTKQLGTIMAMYEGPEPAQDALAKVEGVK